MGKVEVQNKIRWLNCKIIYMKRKPFWLFLNTV